jgi:hypothetical protein
MARSTRRVFLQSTGAGLTAAISGSLPVAKGEPAAPAIVPVFERETGHARR